MGYKLIILLGLLLGVLYSLHILVKDFQAITATGRFLRLLFKRDVTSYNLDVKPSVRWKRILSYDATQCARYLYCSLGTEPTSDETLRGFTLMLTMEPREEDNSSLAVFKQAYEIGNKYGKEGCRMKYLTCPFSEKLLFQLLKYLLKH